MTPANSHQGWIGGVFELDWSIFDELAERTERQRRLILRSHQEKGFTQADADEIQLRDRVDKALDRLLLLETAIEVGYLPFSLPPDATSFKALLTSSAFVRYLDAYDYFGIRFLVARISDDMVTKFPHGKSADVNELPVALPAPPLPVLPEGDGLSAGVRMHRFLQSLEPESDDEDIVAALQFLDGFVESQEEPASYEPDEHAQDQRNEPTRYELWLRGLLDAPQYNDRFKQLSRGLVAFAWVKAAFYVNLEGESRLQRWRDEGRIRGAWSAEHPLTARFGTNDLYWLARLLRVDLSPIGLVSGDDISWLRLIAEQLRLNAEGDPSDQRRTDRESAVDTLLAFDEVLHGVLDYASDLIQNTVAISRQHLGEATTRERIPARPRETRDWRTTYDEELNEIYKQRRDRRFDKAVREMRWRDDVKGGDDGWSRRTTTGVHIGDLVGLAFSGGGIRSATFNLGVLQRLQELDLLRHVDYLSTVSGGGYIGAWLLGNVHRSPYWLTRLTDWTASIDHLRRFSNYLAPRRGLMSADTWTMWLSWIRNAALIQLSAATWVAVLLVGVRLIKFQFTDTAFVTLSESPANRVLVIIVALLTFVICLSLRQTVTDRSLSQSALAPGTPLARSVATAKRVAVVWAVGLVELGSFLTAAMLWASRHRGDVTTGLYSAFLKTRYLDWLVPLVSLFISFAIVSRCSIGRTPHQGEPAEGFTEREQALRMQRAVGVVSLWVARKLRRIFAAIGIADAVSARLVRRTQQHRLFAIGVVLLRIARELRRMLAAVGVAAAALGVVYLGLCGVQWTFVYLSGDDWAVWFAYVLGGPLVVFTMGLAIIMVIGLIGPNSPDWRREWWTRFGAWLGICGVGFLALALTSAFAPALVMWGLTLDRPSIKWGAVLSWLGTVAAGLLAGNSEKTNGSERESLLAQAISWFSQLAAVLFIVGALILAATAVHVLLVKIWTDSAIKPSAYWPAVNKITVSHLGWSFLVLVIAGAVMSWRFEINIFGLNQFYRNRLIRCYLGATRWRPGMRKPHPFTGFDPDDDLPLWVLRRGATRPGHTAFRGPFPIINCSLNLGGSSDLAVQTRQSASFVLTPLRCGADRPRVGYALTHKGHERYANGVFLGQAISVSGAAASPNMGYSTSPLVAVLLTMFNVRLAWWFPNPGRSASVPFVSLAYLVRELFGLADEKNYFINVSDGGHFENLGIYELVRRRCKVIIACDAECDTKLAFGSLGNVVRICETDFGARIDIDVASIERIKDSPLSRSHCTVGRITYANGSQGYLVYLKSSVTGDEDVGIAQYRAAHPSFPHESTGDQFFEEDQFESYRRLGHHIASQAFRSIEADEPNLVTMAGKLADMWVAHGAAEEFVTQANVYSALMERLGRETKLHALFGELMLGTPAPSAVITKEERAVCLQLLQLMENTYLALRLEEFWTHPDHRGWVILFSQWARSKKFRQVWKDSHNIYGIRFAYFCHERLGLYLEREAQRS